MNKKSSFVVAIIVYLISSTISYFGVRAYYARQSQIISPGGEELPDGVLVAVDPGAPKTEECPLNGQMFTKAERQAWEKRRPLMVMIENHDEARPQSGLNTADIVYEAVAEGGITRFMGAFYCDAITQDNTVGPVRSARTYFLDWASEYSSNPLYAHVGGANVPGPADALGQIVDYGWALENDLNQFALTVKECWRDYNRLGRQVATEHTMYCSTEALWKIGAERGWEAKGSKGAWDKDFVAWNFADPEPSSSPTATSIAFDFWEDYTDYAVKWNYDAASNMYLRTNGDAIHKDRNDDSQLSAQTIIVQFVTEKGPIDDHKHMLYGTIGSGEALVFQNGDVIKAEWSKKDRLSRTLFTDSKGKNLELARGRIWIEAVPKGTTVDY